ncbi:MAG: DUF4156 domain-containing protein [Thermoanaerobaculales bacterium]|nr:DUF4156 domain-containing protein [Thermoanaerobaculales bacterium]
MKLMVVVLILVLTSGCMSLSPEAQKVRVTNNEAVVADCEYLGEVSGKTGWGSAGESNAYKAMKKNAAEIGADTVFLITQADTEAFIPTYRGEAYRCNR